MTISPPRGGDLCVYFYIHEPWTAWGLAQRVPSGLSQATPFRSHIPWVECPVTLYGNFLSQETSASSFPLHPQPQGLAQQKGQQEDAARRAHVSVLRVSTSCFLDSGSQGEARRGAAGGEGQDQLLLLAGSSASPPPLLWPSPWPGAEGTRLEKCSYRTQGEELGLEVPPAVQGEQGV